MAYLLRAALPLGLDIFDRNYETGMFPFPDEYKGCVIGSLPYSQLCNEYSKYRVFLNVNSVINSPTMFSRRVFELLACGTPIVSSYALGIEEMFGPDIVWMVETEKQAYEAIHTLLHDDKEWRRRSLAGIRTVFAQHTYAHRLACIFEKTGIDFPILVEPKTLLIYAVSGQHDLEMLVEFCNRQSWNKFELIVLSDFLNKVPDSLPQGTRLLSHKTRQGDWLSDILSKSKYQLLGFISPSVKYGEHYLQDLINSWRYAKAPILGKSTTGKEFAYDQPFDQYGCLLRAEELIMEHRLVGQALMPDLKGLQSYSIDREEFEC